MVINVSVQYNGGILPDILLLTTLGNPFDTMESFRLYSQCFNTIYNRPFDCSEGLVAFRFFFKQLLRAPPTRVWVPKNERAFSRSNKFPKTFISIATALQG